MCTLSIGRNLNKIDGKLDNIFTIDGYRIRRYVDDHGETVLVIVRREENVRRDSITVNDIDIPVI